jgi:hypothetical protein
VLAGNEIQALFDAMGFDPTLGFFTGSITAGRWGFRLPC